MPHRLAARSQKPRGDGYQPPPWLWGADADKQRRLGAEPLRLPRGRGIFFGYLAPLLRLSLVQIFRIRPGSA